MTASVRPLPCVDDDDTGPFFAAAARGELAIRVCACGAVSHLPVAYCHQCGGFEGQWTPVSGRARIASWTTVGHSVHAAFPAPYTVVLVELEDRPTVRLLGYLPGDLDLHPGQPMRVVFEDLGDGVVLPQWEPC